MKCPHCRNKLLQKSGSTTRLRIQGAVEFGADGACHAHCYWCKAEVTVPIELRKAVDVEEERFILVTSGK